VLRYIKLFHFHRKYLEFHYRVKLSSGTSATAPPVEKPLSLSDLKPISILLSFVTFGVKTLSTGNDI
jgi:hypothetical protein